MVGVRDRGSKTLRRKNRAVFMAGQGSKALALARMRVVVPLVACLLVLAACGETATAQKKSSATNATSTTMQSLTINIGRFPHGTANAFVTKYMEIHHLVEKAGKTLGLNLTVNWINESAAPAVIAGLTSHQIDIGPLGSSIYVGLVAKNEPVTPISLSNGHFGFVLAVPKGSPIRNLGDLKGKKVGAIAGTDIYNVLAEMVLAKFGTANLTKAGVTFVNVSSPGQLARVPKGLDASVTPLTTFLQAQAAGDNVTWVANSYGETGPHYSGSAGQGAGHVIPSAKNSVFWPEGFYGHRSVIIAANSFLKAHQDAAVAFLVAQQEALQALDKMTPSAVAALVSSDWGVSPSIGAQLVTSSLTYQRGWAYITSGDAKVLYEQGKLTVADGSASSSVSWSALKSALLKGASVAKKAYEIMHQVPSQQVFLNTSKDLRGYPTWEGSSWKKP